MLVPFDRGRRMRQDRPTISHILPDDGRGTNNLAHAVVAAYRAAMADSANDEKAVDAAVRVWRERYPDASVQLARPAVADILSHKLYPLHLEKRSRP
jgi:hypothetical protein